MPSWDRQPAPALRRRRDAAVRTQLRDVVGPFSPYYRERLAALGLKAGAFKGVSDLAKLPATGERDVCPDGDPRGAARLVLQASEVGYAVHASGPQLRRALLKRLALPGSYRRQVEGDTRPTTYSWTGLGVRFPVASTRSDLDVVARAGARLWQVLGVTPADVVVTVLPPEPTPTRTALELAALAAGSPAFHVGPGVAAVERVLALVPVTVLVADPGGAAELLDELAQAGADVSGLRTVVLAGAVDRDQRRVVVQSLLDAGASEAVVVACYAPAGARLVWGECRESGRSGQPAGFHTYPDLEVVELVDPETGESHDGTGPGELTLSQLGLRGSVLLRWRTGDLVAGPLEQSPCPACGRTVPRVPSDVAVGALVPEQADGGDRLDLRAVAGALAGRPDIADWRLELGTSRRRGRPQLLAYVIPAGGVDATDAVVGAARDVQAAAGALPTQFVAADPTTLPGGRPLTRRIVRRD